MSVDTLAAIIKPISLPSIPASCSALFTASQASEVVVSVVAMCLFLIPVRELIHSSDVSIMAARSSFETTLCGRQLPVPTIFIEFPFRD